MNRNLTMVALVLILAVLCAVLFSAVNKQAAESHRQAVEQERLASQVQKLQDERDREQVYGLVEPASKYPHLFDESGRPRDAR